MERRGGGRKEREWNTKDVGNGEDKGEAATRADGVRLRELPALRLPNFCDDAHSRLSMRATRTL
jgi:hypothetical protein